MLFDFQTHLKNQPTYRLSQIKQAVFVDLYDDWDQVTTLPQELKNQLKQTSPLRIEAQTFPSLDQNSTKALLTLSDGLKIESVLLRHIDGRSTVCISTQVGCSLGCKFCSTGRMGFKRNLTSDEIVEQVLFFARLLKKQKHHLDNIVFMGMGEPFLNYDNLLSAIKIIHDPRGFNLGMRHISISTIGIISGIQKMTHDLPQVNLAISLHAPNDKLRQQIMPATHEYPFGPLFASIENYVAQTRRRVMFEYILLENTNDQTSHAQKLSQLIKSHPLYFVNLVKYNLFPGGEIFRASSAKQSTLFRNVLEQNNVPFTQRYSFGTDINAACGQLAA